MQHRFNWVAMAAAVLIASGRLCPAAPGADNELPRELRTVEVSSSSGVVVCASEAAARAGTRMLEAGGNAVDAAVAAAFALGAAEPAASGLGGQTYLLICPSGGRCVAIDGSVVVPLHVDRADLQRMRDANRMYGHKLAATPGALAALVLALARFGTRPLAEVMAPAIEIADAGVAFTPTERSFAADYLGGLRESPYLANLFLLDGLYLRPPEAVFCLSELRNTLRRIAAAGPGTFYQGEIAGEIADDMERNGGWVTRESLALVRPVERAPYVGSYRGYEVVSFPMPGGGGSVVEALQILDSFPVARLRTETVDRQTLLIEAVRLALTDEYEVDTVMPIAARHLVDPAWARQRAGRIRTDRALGPEELRESERLPASERDTTQLSVADRWGNAVSVTQTLGRVFGACAASPRLGVMYNELLEGFDLVRTGRRGALAPMRVPFTSQAPTIVRRDGRPYLVLGSVGTGRITSAVVLAISNVIDRGMSLKDAVASPRILWGGSNETTVYLELAGELTNAFADELASRGYSNIYRLKVQPGDPNIGAFGAVNSVAIGADGRMVGVGDPRRQGVAVAAGDATRAVGR